ncbi:MAG: Gfo/Idh/MocA family oxidoreductase [Bacteroidales bacterium]|jgi:predicted dehydrogenase
MKEENKGISRRKFLGTSALGMAGVLILPAIGFGRYKSVPGGDPKLIRLGFIGLGQQSMSLLAGFMQVPGVDIIAGSDVYGVKRRRFEKRVLDFYKKTGKKGTPATYEKFQDLLKHDDIDAVVIAAPDHTHAMIAIAACRAGKDVYLEKPMTFTIYEGQQLRKVVRDTNRILGIGSQQRSDSNFQHAVKVVQNGDLGMISKVNAYVGAPPGPYDLPEEPVPADLNWDLWLGPLTGNFHYNHELDPPITVSPEKNEQLWGAWRWYKGLGGGFTTDWGAHMFDIAQWGLGMDKNGPVEISPLGTEFISYKYASGTIMTSEAWDDNKSKGVKFWGSKGWIEITRDFFHASDSKFLPSKKEKAEGPYETRVPHQANFIEAVRTRKDPVVPVEIGHSSCTVCNLGNIAVDLNRTILWDPANEKFVGDIDGEATKRTQYTYRNGWNLL